MLISSIAVFGLKSKRMIFLIKTKADYSDRISHYCLYSLLYERHVFAGWSSENVQLSESAFVTRVQMPALPFGVVKTSLKRALLFYSSFVIFMGQKNNKKTRGRFSFLNKSYIGLTYTYLLFFSSFFWFYILQKGLLTLLCTYSRNWKLYRHFFLILGNVNFMLFRYNLCTGYVVKCSLLFCNECPITMFEWM